DSLLVLADSLFAAASAVPNDAVTWPFAKRRFAMLRGAQQSYPEDPEIWYAVGEGGYHFGFGALTVPERDILAAFDRAIALDSAFSPAYEHTPELAANVGGAALARRYTQAFLRRHP